MRNFLKELLERLKRLLNGPKEVECHPLFAAARA